MLTEGLQGLSFLRGRLHNNELERNRHLIAKWKEQAVRFHTMHKSRQSLPKGLSYKTLMRKAEDTGLLASGVSLHDSPQESSALIGPRAFVTAPCWPEAGSAFSPHSLWIMKTKDLSQAYLQGMSRPFPSFFKVIAMSCRKGGRQGTLGLSCIQPTPPALA